MKTIRIAIVMFTIALLMAFGLSQLVNAQSTTGNYVLSHWQWDVEGQSWAAPECTRSLVDLRSIPQMAMRVTAEGYGMFVIDESCPLPVGGILLADGPNETITSGVLSSVESALGFPRGTVEASTPVDIVWELFTTHSDITGETAPKPLMPERDLRLEIYLDGTVQRSERFNRDEHSFVLESLRLGYETIKELALIDDSEIHLRAAGFWRDKYGFDVRTSEQQLDGIIEPETTIEEYWTCADDASSIDCDLTWTLIAGTWELDFTSAENTSACGGAIHDFCGMAEADTSLSSADMEAKTWGEVATDTNHYLGPIIRTDGSTITGYLGAHRENATNGIILGKLVSGTFTNLGSFGLAYTPIRSQYVGVRAEGSSISLLIDNSVLGSPVTDSSIDGSIVGGLNAGITHSMDSTTQIAIFLSFTATDELTVSTPTVTPTPTLGPPASDLGDFRRAIVYDSFGTNVEMSLVDRVPNVRPSTLDSWRHITSNGGSWEIDPHTETAVETSAIDDDHKIVINSDISDGVVRVDITREANQHLGLVVRSDGSGDQNNIFIWHNGSSLNIAKRIGGAFTFVTNTSFTWPAGVTWSMEVVLNGCSLDVDVDNVRRLANVTICDDELVNNTHHGLHSHDGSSPNGTFDNFAVFPTEESEESDAVDFTPFFYIAGFLIGLTLVGYGERYRVGQYIMAGAVILVAATIPTGLAWLIVLSALAFIPAMYRGYLHITIANNQGRVE